MKTESYGFAQLLINIVASPHPTVITANRAFKPRTSKNLNSFFGTETPSFILCQRCLNGIVDSQLPVISLQEGGNVTPILLSHPSDSFVPSVNCFYLQQQHITSFANVKFSGKSSPYRLRLRRMLSLAVRTYTARFLLDQAPQAYRIRANPVSTIDHET